ncbi:MAG: hypothetical protein ACJAR4_002684 [Psychroserpens sp.]|jgi:hypothetical protein
MAFLYRVFNDHNIGIYVYDVFDKDTNGDGKLPYKDLKSIYISKHDGSGFNRV